MFKILGRVCVVIVLFQFVFVGVLIAFGGRFLSSPQFEPEEADLIAILGGGVGERLKKGAELYRLGYANKILVTGFPEMDGNTLPTYSIWRQKYLLEQGIPEQSLILDNSAKSSFTEAVAIRKLMLESKWRKVLIVSDPPHLRRLNIMLSSVFTKNDNLSFYLIASEPRWWRPQNWWADTISAQFVLLEVLKLGYFFLQSKSPGPMDKAVAAPISKPALTS